MVLITNDRAMPWISPWILEQSRQTEQELRGEDE